MAPPAAPPPPPARYVHAARILLELVWRRACVLCSDESLPFNPTPYLVRLAMPLVRASLGNILLMQGGSTRRVQGRYGAVSAAAAHAFVLRVRSSSAKVDETFCAATACGELAAELVGVEKCSMSTPCEVSREAAYTGLTRDALVVCAFSPSVPRLVRARVRRCPCLWCTRPIMQPAICAPISASMGGASRPNTREPGDTQARGPFVGIECFGRGRQ